jgi:hypothetical protein
MHFRVDVEGQFYSARGAIYSAVTINDVGEVVLNGLEKTLSRLERRNESAKRLLQLLKRHSTFRKTLMAEVARIMKTEATMKRLKAVVTERMRKHVLTPAEVSAAKNKDSDFSKVGFTDGYWDAEKLCYVRSKVGKPTAVVITQVVPFPFPGFRDGTPRKAFKKGLDIVERLYNEWVSDPIQREMLVAHLAAAAGACSPEQWASFVLAYGKTGNGKGTWALFVSETLPAAGTASLSAQQFVGTRDPLRANSALAQALKARLVRVDEAQLTRGAVFSTELLKKLSGGDPTNARSENDPNATDILLGRLFWFSNMMPTFDFEDAAMERRFKLVHFDGAFAGAGAKTGASDLSLSAQLKTERMRAAHWLYIIAAQKRLAGKYMDMPLPFASIDAARNYVEGLKAKELESKHAPNMTAVVEWLKRNYETTGGVRSCTNVGVTCPTRCDMKKKAAGAAVCPAVMRIDAVREAYEAATDADFPGGNTWVVVMCTALRRAFPLLPPPKSVQDRHINCRPPHVVNLRRLTENSSGGDAGAAVAAAHPAECTAGF